MAPYHVARSRLALYANVLLRLASDWTLHRSANIAVRASRSLRTSSTSPLMIFRPMRAADRSDSLQTSIIFASRRLDEERSARRE